MHGNITGRDDAMPYLVCDRCDVYYEIQDKDEMLELSHCECGNPLKYYDSLEEYLYTEDKVQNTRKQDEMMEELVNSCESAIARIIIYCVRELPFPMGINNTIGILKGSKSSFILDYNLNNLSTYSIFADFSKKKLEHFIRVLIDLKLLKIKYLPKYQNMPTLALTEKGEDFLLNKKIFKIGIFNKENTDYMERIDKDLYGILKDLRRQIATENDFPAYIVCSNETLLEITHQMPTDYHSMIAINGIGKSFMAKYGEQFLRVIKDYLG